MDNIIYNWTNILKHDDQSQVALITKEAETYKQKGYAKNEVCDIFVSKKYASAVIDTALDTVFPVKKSKNVVSKKVFPKSYKEIKSSIDSTMDKKGVTFVLDLLFNSDNPIIKISQKEKESLYRVAEIANDNDSYRKHIHEFISPWLEEELYKNVVSCQNKSFVKTSAVNYVTLDCSCDKFIKQNYKELGLACEHLIHEYTSNI